MGAGLLIGTILFFIATPIFTFWVCYYLNKRDQGNAWF